MFILQQGGWSPREAEVPAIIIVSDGVEGTFVDLHGGSRHEQAEAKLSIRGRGLLHEGEEIRSPKRKVIRVESEETQDYVREEKNTMVEAFLRSNKRSTQNSGSGRKDLIGLR